MLKYIVIELCDTSVSYCHYPNDCETHALISLENLRAAILYAMKQNLNIQFLYPDYELSKEYCDLIESIDHVKIVPLDSPYIDEADIVVLNGLSECHEVGWSKDRVYILRISKCDLNGLAPFVEKVHKSISRLNVVVTDIDTFSEGDLQEYSKILIQIQGVIADSFASAADFQLNLLSDRLVLDKMNNCNAGFETICVAPNGRFYACPAFYHENDDDCCGDLANGLNIKNPQLYRLDHAPICRHCDAYQCKRCVWLNRKTTLEINTPSHEQCYMSHLERNSSRNVIADLKKSGYHVATEIPEIDYMDPFDKRNDW